MYFKLCCLRRKGEENGILIGEALFRVSWLKEGGEEEEEEEGEKGEKEEGGKGGSAATPKHKVFPLSYEPTHQT